MWLDLRLKDVVCRLDAGVSVNSEDRHHLPGEVGVLKTSAVHRGSFRPMEHKAVARRESRLVSTPVDGESILVSRMNTPDLVGDSAYVKDSYPTLFLPDRLWQLRFSRGLNVRWLACVLLSDGVRSYIHRSATGTSGSMKNLSKEAFLSAPISFPPIREQRRIAEVLDTVDKAIQDAAQLISKLNQMKKGLVHDLLTKGIDDNGEVRQSPEEAPHLYKDSPLGQIPSGWELSSLMSRITLPTGQLDPKAEPFRSWVLVAPDHIEVGTGRLMERRSAMEQGAISGKYEFAVGDVVYSKIRPHLRKAMLADFQGLCSADMYPLRPSIDLNSRFLLALVLGEHFSKFAESVSVRSGFPKINRNELAEYRAAFPSRREQDLIAEKFHAIDQCLDREQAQFCKLQTLKRGLMEDLLTGRVRVSDAGAGAP
jgi:type I restriction enzyme S subunit